jgi:hypothetical protein
LITKYEKLYNQLIERAKRRKLDCYSEWHHIVPRSLGGVDEKSNLVQLTYREHFLAHWLLTKFITGRGRRSMVYALQCMGTMDPSGQRFVSSWQYDVARRTIKEHFEGVRLERMLAEMKAEREKLEALYLRIAASEEAKKKLKEIQPSKRFRWVKKDGKKEKVFMMTSEELVGASQLDPRTNKIFLEQLANKLVGKKPFNHKWQ